MNINEIITAYKEAKEAEKEAKKQADTMKQLIMNYANGKTFFETDSYNVVIDTRKTTTIDTKTLYKDFPDFKNVYGKVTTYEVITAKEKQQEKKTA